MSARVAILGALVLAACDPPQPTLDLTLSAGPAQECPSTDCDDIPMTCKMYMSIRILDPDDRMAPFQSDCIEVPQTDRKRLCSIGGIELEPRTLPYRDLEVQVALYRDTQVTFDDTTGLPVCPSSATYDDADGFPISGDVTPALGGRTYYRPGDSTISVTLGCTDITELANDECEGVANTTVRATVDDFDDHFSVSSTTANRLSIAAGEPQTNGPISYTLNPNDVTALDRVPNVSPPAWAREVPRLFQRSLCLTVLDDTPQSTTTVTCRNKGVNITVDSYSLTGIRLTKTSLDQILAALAMTSFPVDGLTIGVVVDNGTTVGGQVVTPTAGTIEYLNATRTAATGSSTSSGTLGGVFVSRDAPYGTEFTTTRLGTSATAFGGRIAGKVTIVVLDLSNPTSPE